MKHLLFINTYYYPNGRGGAEKSTQILAETFANENYEVSVITSSNRNYTQIINGVTVYYVKMGNIYWLGEAHKKNNFQKLIWHIIDSFGLNNVQGFEKKVALIKPDVVFTSNLVQFSSKIWKNLSQSNIPIVHIIRDHYQITMSTTLTDKPNIISKYFFGKFLGLRKKKLSHYVDVVIGISDYILHKHITLGYFKNAVIKKVIHNPVVINPKFPHPNRNSKPIFGYVGALNSKKGVDLLLENFSQNTSIELLLFGKGKQDYVNKLKNVSQQFPNIKYMGYETPENIFQKIDILIVPSIINEAFGRVIVEAYSFGIPVIGSNKGGIPELIDVGETGFIFNPDIKFDLSKIIMESGLDKKVEKSFKDKSREKSHNFDSKLIMRKYSQLLNNG